MKWKSFHVASAALQTSGSSSEPSGQSFSRSQRQPLEMHVTPSLHTNCFGLQVLGAEWRRRKRRRKEGGEKHELIKSFGGEKAAASVSVIFLFCALISRRGLLCSVNNGPRWPLISSRKVSTKYKGREKRTHSQEAKCDAQGRGFARTGGRSISRSTFPDHKQGFQHFWNIQSIKRTAWPVNCPSFTPASRGERGRSGGRESGHSQTRDRSF